jgi:hypothetical protein
MAISFVVLVNLVSYGYEPKKVSAKVWFVIDYSICYPLVDCLVAPATCDIIADCLCILVASPLPCSCLVVALPSPRLCLAVASPSPRHRLVPPFCPPSSSSRLPSPPHEDSDGDGDCHRRRRFLSLSYWCFCQYRRRSSRCRLRCLCRRCPDVSVVARGGCSGGTATPTVIRDGPNDRTTKNC